MNNFGYQNPTKKSCLGLLLWSTESYFCLPEWSGSYLQKDFIPAHLTALWSSATQKLQAKGKFISVLEPQGQIGPVGLILVWGRRDTRRMAAFSKFELVDYYTIKYICGKTCPVPPMMSTSSSDSGKSPATSGSVRGQRRHGKCSSPEENPRSEKVVSSKGFLALTQFVSALHMQNPNEHTVPESLKCLWCDVPLETLKRLRVQSEGKVLLTKLIGHHKNTKLDM